MANSKLEVIRDQYDATNERDWARVMSHYADDVELVVPETGGIRAGTFTGPDAVGRWFGDWIASFDRDLRFEIRELRELADGSVFLIADHRARGRASGIELGISLFWLYDLRGDKIARLEQFQSLEESGGAIRNRERG